MGMGTPRIRPDWTNDMGQAFRLDPADDRHAMRFGDARPMDVVLDRGGAVVKCRLGCGVPLSMALPNRVFQGVAARAFDNEDGSQTVWLELLHADPDLSVPLSLWNDVEAAAGDWHDWARRCALPMLVVDADGSVDVVKPSMQPARQVSHTRRKRFAQLARRPRFLRRRRVGQIGPMERIDAREIIARS